MNRQLVLIAAVSAILGYCTACDSSSQTAVPAKKIVTLDAIQDVTIALPNTISQLPFYDFGPNLQGSLANKMIQSNRYILDQPQPQVAEAAVMVAASPLPAPSPSPTLTGSPDTWDGSSVVPSGELKFFVDALQLQTGDRGDRMFYGFNERFRNPFNDGLMKYPEEFPLSLVTFQPNWFDRSFDDVGTAPLDSQSGLDLGQGFSLNALVAWVDLKYASYHSEIRVRVELDAPLANRHEVKSVQVTGSGFYYDIVGGYEMWSGGIGLARRDAMTAAFNNAFAGTFSVIDGWIQNLPLTAKVFQVAANGEIFLNTGANSNVPAGTKYQAVSNPSLVFEVTESVPSGSIAKLDSGNLQSVQTSMVLVQQQTAPAPVPSAVPSSVVAAPSAELVAMAEQGGATAVASESVTLDSTNLPQSNFAGSNYNVSEDWEQALLLSVTQGWALPYRIWRYFEYDQSYSLASTSGAESDQAKNVSDAVTPAPSPGAPDLSSQDGVQAGLPQGAENWASEMKSQPWASQIGLDVAPAMTAEGPVVAVIDSGVDYNHPAINGSVWVNSAPVTDPDGNQDLYGWDFISGDPRPYDDAYRGTEVASAVLGVAPLAKIMPLKVFNPFGITSSAAIYGAFQYAVDHGAKIIVCSWATRVQTQTLALAVQYAQKHGVLVVAAAGDLGDDLSKIPAYPASLSKVYNNVLTVTGVTTANALVTVNSLFANFDPATVGIAAPGQSILVAQPRDHSAQETSTGLAAALVAGAVARNIAASNGAGTYLDWIQAVKAQSQAVPALAGSVQGGLVLKVK